MITKDKLMASLKIWIVIYPSITLFLYLFAETIAAFPVYIRTLILTGILVPWMMFIALPAMNAFIRLLSPKS